MGVAMIITCAIPYNVYYRKLLFICYIIFLILELILLIAVIILIFTVGDETLTDDERVGLLILVIIWACIYIPIGLIGLQILYWGWKEQEKRKERKEDEKDAKKKEKKEMEAHNQSQMMMMQQQQQMQPGQQVAMGTPVTDGHQQQQQFVNTHQVQQK